MRKFLAVTILTLFIAVVACAQRAMSDREADELKGKVSKVVTERARLTTEAGSRVEGKRELDSIVTYGADGARLKREFYNSSGGLKRLEVYTSVDGDRAMKEEVLIPDNVGGVGSMTYPNRGKTKFADQKYTYRFKYKYDDQGNRIEESWYRNDGSLQLRSVSVYDEKGHNIEFRSYTENGRLYARRVRTYDDGGNVTEESLSWPGSPITERLSFSYEYDRQRNWIKRKSMRWVTKDGKSYSELFAVVYRDLTYF
jgi:hypothetical protein